MEKKHIELKNRVEELLQKKDYLAIKNLLASTNNVEIADMFEHIEDKETIMTVYRLLSKDLAADVFSYLPSKYKTTIIESLTDVEIGQVMNDLYLDDAVDMLEEMPANVVKKLLAVTDDKKRESINILLKYPKYSAGSLMTVEFVDLRDYMTIKEVLERIRKTGVDKETINYCYVTDEEKHLIGIMSLREIILADENEVIRNIMEHDVISVHTMDDQEDVAKQFRKYDFTVMPVVDNEDRIVGIITADDIMDILEEEATEDMQKMAAIIPTEKPYMHTSVVELYRKRIPWLLFLMLSATITGTIINNFENALSAYVVLASFIPMLMDTGGNGGSQSSTSIIRALSTDKLKFSDLPAIIWKEFRVAILCGGTLAICNFFKILLIDNVSIMIAVVVCLTLFCIIIMAKLIGCILPMVADRIGFDPAVMASPIITTIVDAVSLILYFNIATVLLHL